MRLRVFVWTGIVVASWMWLSAGADSPQVVSTDVKPTLPGAQAEIDAAKYPSLQAAIDALPAEGGVVHIPPGTFEIHEPLVVGRSDVLLQGAGTATHIKNVNTSGASALIIKDPRGPIQRVEDRPWRIMLSNFRITGNEKSGHGIEVFQINEFFIQGVTVSYHGGDGIRLDHCYEDPRISDCLITYNKQTGLDLLATHDIVVSANHFEENHDGVRCIDCYNLCMTGNCMDDHLGDGVVIENTYGSVLSGNMIEECDGRAIVLARDAYGTTLAANVIAHNGGGIDLVDAHGCAVSANTFVELKLPPKAKDGAQPPMLDTRSLRIAKDSGRITVTGNNFCDGSVGNGKVILEDDGHLAGGIVLEGTRDIAISGNSFSGLTTPALELRAPQSRRVVFSGNVLVDAPSQHAQLQDSVTTENVENP